MSIIKLAVAKMVAEASVSATVAKYVSGEGVQLFTEAYDDLVAGRPPTKKMDLSNPDLWTPEGVDLFDRVVYNAVNMVKRSERFNKLMALKEELLKPIPTPAQPTQAVETAMQKYSREMADRRAAGSYV